MISGKTILITGGTGTIGRYLVNHLSDQNPKRIIVFSRDEDKQFYMKQFSASKIVDFVIGDVRDKNRLDEVMEGVDYVLHAAAMKQVPIAEENPYEAVMTNIVGTQNVIQSARANHVEKVVIISSDKAVYPTNSMGMTKGICEKIARYSKVNEYTTISIIRLGNVLGSRGSVISIWNNQIKADGRIKLTSTNMTRFIMSLEDVLSLVLHALKYGRNGDIIIDQMKSCRILDLARIICDKNDLDPEKDISLIGIRPGEKEYEEICTNEELNKIYFNDGYYHISKDINKLTESIPVIQRSDHTDLLTKEQLSQWLKDKNII